MRRAYDFAAFICTVYETRLTSVLLFASFWNNADFEITFPKRKIKEKKRHSVVQLGNKSAFKSVTLFRNGSVEAWENCPLFVLFNLSFVIFNCR